MPRQVPTFRPAGWLSRQEQNRDHDRRRRRDAPWRGWYNQAIWKRRRREQLERKPVCERCDLRGRVAAATVANHKVPHRGDWELFVRGELESLCKSCHDREVQAEERRVMTGGGEV